MKVNQTFSEKKKILITTNILYKLALQQYHPAYLRTYTKDALQSIIDDCSENIYDIDFKGKIEKCQIFKSSNTSVVSE